MPEIITRKEALALGLKRYFTGKPCCHGHVAERQSDNGKCLRCRMEQRTYDSAKRRAYCVNNLDKLREQGRSAYYRKRDRILASRRAYYYSNWDKLRAIRLNGYRRVSAAILALKELGIEL